MTKTFNNPVLSNDIFKTAKDNTAVWKGELDIQIEGGKRKWICEGCDSDKIFDYDKSLRESSISKEVKLVFKPCVECSIRKTMSGIGVPKSLLHCSLENFSTESDQEKKALKNASDLLTVKRGGTLLLCGEFGLGKSHIAVAFARKFRISQKEPGQVFFVTPASLQESLGIFYNNSKAFNPVNFFKSPAALIIDDLSISERKDVNELLLDGIKSRVEEEKIILITTNLTRPEFRNFVGLRTADRMKQSMEIVEFEGKSKRSKNGFSE